MIRVYDSAVLDAMVAALHDSEYHPCVGNYKACVALGGRAPSFEWEAEAILDALADRGFVLQKEVPA